MGRVLAQVRELSAAVHNIRSWMSPKWSKRAPCSGVIT